MESRKRRATRNKKLQVFPRAIMDCRPHPAIGLKAPKRKDIVTTTITSLPPSKKSKTEKDVKDEECAICLESKDSGEIGPPLLCKHSFHKVCIEHWLREKRECPVCRSPVVEYAVIEYAIRVANVMRFMLENLPVEEFMETLKSFDLYDWVFFFG